MLRKILVAVAALVALLPAAVFAQLSVDLNASTRYERAEILSEQAWLLANQKRDFSAAASTLREAALLRDADQEKIRVLVNAGHFHFYANRPLSAVSALREAGEVALTLGKVEEANKAFLDAAWVAARAGEIRTASQLLARTQPMSRETLASVGASIASMDR